MDKPAGGAVPLDYSPYGAPRQPPTPKGLPDPKEVEKIQEERRQNRQFARYRHKPTQQAVERAQAVGGK